MRAAIGGDAHSCERFGVPAEGSGRDSGEGKEKTFDSWMCVVYARTTRRPDRCTAGGGGMGASRRYGLTCETREAVSGLASFLLPSKYLSFLSPRASHSHHPSLVVAMRQKKTYPRLTRGCHFSLVMVSWRKEGRFYDALLPSLPFCRTTTQSTGHMAFRSP